ncbi:hypothetical protein BDW66DRAFT_152934 [Aspergillus desertorum]
MTSSSSSHTIHPPVTECNKKEQASPAGTSPNAPNPDEFPDGERKAWSVVLGAWCCLCCSYGWVNTIGSFQTYYQEDSFRRTLPVRYHGTGTMNASLAIYGKIYDSHGPEPLLA